MIKDFLRTSIGIGGRHIQPLMRKVDSSLTIFVLHDVTDEPAPFTQENDIWVSTEAFRKQMEFVAENFNVISMEELLKGAIPRRAAMITFDDGFAGTFKNGLAKLAEMNLPSTVFLNMSPVYGENYWAERVFFLCDKVPTFLSFLADHGIHGVKQPQLHCTRELVEAYEREQGDEYLSDLQSYLSPYVSLEELLKADENPLITLGSHLYTHYNVKNLSDQVLLDQFDKNSVGLANLKRYLPVFAFPFGQPESCFTARQAGSLLRFGAQKLFTSWPSPNTNHVASVLDRIALTNWHQDNRLWFQVLRYPLAEILGQKGPDWDYRREESL